MKNEAYFGRSKKLNHLLSSTAIATIEINSEKRSRLSFDSWFLVDQFKQRFGRVLGLS